MIIVSHKPRMTKADVEAMRDRERALFAAWRVMERYEQYNGRDALLELFAANNHDMLKTADAIRQVVAVERERMISYSHVTP